MPPRVKYDREEIADAAFRLVREKGEDALNARAVSAALGCSTQPLFRAFSSMEELRAEVLRRAYAVYESYLMRSGEFSPGTPYKGSGIAYIFFAKEEPNLFRLLFMRDRPREEQGPDRTLGPVLDLLMARTGYGRERAEAFHRHMWVYVHGLATMLATHFVSIQDETLYAMMGEAFEAMRLLFDAHMDT